MNVYATNSENFDGSALQYAHQQLAAILGNGKFPPALTSRARRIRADG